jgi:hypothetical protein
MAWWRACLKSAVREQGTATGGPLCRVTKRTYRVSRDQRWNQRQQRRSRCRAASARSRYHSQARPSQQACPQRSAWQCMPCASGLAHQTCACQDSSRKHRSRLLALPRRPVSRWRPPARPETPDPGPHIGPPWPSPPLLLQPACSKGTAQRLGFVSHRLCRPSMSCRLASRSLSTCT